MVVFIDSSKTPKNQFITILSHANELIEEGITLAVLPSTSFIYSSSPIYVSRTPHLSQWWSESSRELYDPSKRDSHPVQSKIFTLRSSLHSGVNYTGLFPLLARRLSVGEAHWVTSSRAHPLQYTGEFSYIPKYWEWLEDILSRNKKSSLMLRFTALSRPLYLLMTRMFMPCKLSSSIGVRPQIHYIHP